MEDFNITFEKYKCLDFFPVMYVVHMISPAEVFRYCDP